MQLNTRNADKRWHGDYHKQRHFYKLWLKLPQQLFGQPCRLIELVKLELSQWLKLVIESQLKLVIESQLKLFDVVIALVIVKLWFELP